MVELNVAQFVELTGIEVGDRSVNTFTTTLFNALKPIALTIVDSKVKGVNEDTYRLLWSLMIGHLWTLRSIDTSLKSESIGSYSYTRFDEKSTKYMAQFLELVEMLSSSGTAIIVSLEPDISGSLDGLLSLD